MRRIFLVGAVFGLALFFGCGGKVVFDGLPGTSQGTGGASSTSTQGPGPSSSSGINETATSTGTGNVMDLCQQACAVGQQENCMATPTCVQDCLNFFAMEPQCTSQFENYLA